MAATAESLTTKTTTGPVRGRIKDDIILFAGVPYAAPPVDNLRFRRAQPHPEWRDTRDCFKFGPAAPQTPSGGLTDSAPVRWSEDCLTLNISTPSLTAGAGDGRPVLFWIHGGGYRTGQGAIPWYNGARFAGNQDIVVVSINYRMGALGFTDLSAFGSDYATSGVNGTLDQITALRWVVDNIAAFGGNPGRITIAGESAGGFSVATLLGSPMVQGQFIRAIPQSGGGHHTLPAEAGREVTQQLLRVFDAKGPMALEAASVEELLAAQASVDKALDGGPGLTNKLGIPVSPFYPVVGNEVIPEAPIDAIRKGMGNNVAVLTGSNRDETTLWGYGRVDAERLAKAAAGFGDANLTKVYRDQRPGASDADVMIAMTTDHMFRIPAIRLAEARGANTWLYQFDWESRAFEGRLKATHSLEIPFAFDNLDKGGVDVFLGDGPNPQSVADEMHAVWSAFIKTGDPGWPAYTADERLTWCFDWQSGLKKDPAGAEREAWAGLR